MDQQLSYRINEIFNIVTALKERSDRHETRLDRIEIAIGSDSPGVTKILEKLDEHSAKLDEHSATLKEHSAMLGGHSERFDFLERGFGRVETELRTVSGRQNDLISRFLEVRTELTATTTATNEQQAKIVEILQRLTDIEGMFKYMDERVIIVEMEVKTIHTLIKGVLEKLDANLDAKSQIDDLDRRVTRIENRLAA